MKKLFSFIATLSLLANSLFAPLSVLAQEASPSPTPEPITSDSPSPTPTPTPETSVLETIPTPIPTSTPETSATLVSTSEWTFENVEPNKEYENSGVKLTFTRLPENSGNIKVEEITLTPEQIKQTGSLSDKAYDITSDMPDGSFVYNLSLPIPESAKDKNIDVKFAEDISKINSAQTVDSTVTNTDTTVSVNNLNHFTIFVVTTPSPVDSSCTGASVGIAGTDKCFNTIQAAIDAATAGDTINVMSGTYEGFSIVGKSNLIISGSGSSNTTIKPTSLISAGIAHKYTSNMQVSVLVNNSTGITIQNMTIKDNGSAPGNGGPDAIVFWNASSGTIKDSNIAGTYSISGGQSGQGIALDASGAQNADLTVNNVSISGFQKNGIDALNGNGAIGGSTGTIKLSVIGGSITGAGATSAIAQNGIVVWNRGGGSVTGTVDSTTIKDFVYSPQKMAAGILANESGKVTTVKNASFSNCDYFLATGSQSMDATDNNSFNGVVPSNTTLAQLGAIQDKLSDKLEIGSASTTNSIFILPNTAIATPNNRGIQAAIDAVTDGGTVYVAAGTYNESPNINKSLTLQSTNGRDNTTIALQNGPTYLGSLTIDASNVTVNGFTIKGFNASNTTLASTNILLSRGVSSVVVKNNNILVGQIGSNTNGDDGIGLLTTYTESNIGDNIQVKDNIFQTIDNSGAFRAFYINTGINNFTFSGNTITGNFSRSSTTQAKNGLIENNIVTGVGNTSAGFGTWGYPDATVWGHTTFKGNTISGTSKAISINESNNVSIEKNNLSDNGIGVWIGNSSTNISIHNNNLSNESTYGVQNTSTSIVDATSNWWGHISGPKDLVSNDGSMLDTNLNGIGSSAIGAVKYAPWYEDINMLTSTSASAITQGATNVNLYSATVNGTNGSYDASNTYFWWGTISAGPFNVCTSCDNQLPAGWTHDAGLGNKTAGASFSEVITGLTPGTTYHFVAWSFVGGTWYPGEIKSFTTNPIPAPTISGWKDSNNVMISNNGYTNLSNGTAVWQKVDVADHYIYKSWTSIPGNQYQEATPYTTGNIYGTTLPGTLNQGEGNYYFCIIAVDAQGNSSACSEPFMINYDTTPPAVPTGIYFRDTVNNKDIACGGITSARNFDVYWNANTEPDFDHYEYTSYNSDGNTGLINQPFTTPYFNASWWTVPTEGTYGAQLRVVDKAGNKSAWSGGLAGYNYSCKYTSDWTVPATPIITTPIVEQAFKTTPILNKWDQVSDLSGILKYQVWYIYDDGHTFSGSTCTDVSEGGCRDVNAPSTSRNHVPGTNEQGGVTVRVRAVDNAGNFGEWSNPVHYFYDTTAPIGSWVNPIEGNVVSGNVTLNFTADDGVKGSGIKNITYQYKAVGENNFRTDSNIVGNSWNTTGLTLGNYILRAIVTDNAGNVAGDKGEFDITVGVAAVVSDEKAVGTTTTSILVTWTTDRPTTSRVVFDTVSHSSLGTGDNYGYEFSTGEDTSKVYLHSVTIPGLSTGTTYYYRVISHGSPTAVGGEGYAITLTEAGPPMASGGTTGGILGTSTGGLLASTFPQLAAVTGSGEGTENTQETTPEAESNPAGEPEVLGTETSAGNNTWKIVSIIVAVVLAASYGFYRLNKKAKSDTQ